MHMTWATGLSGLTAGDIKTWEGSSFETFPQAHKLCLAVNANTPKHLARPVCYVPAQAGPKIVQGNGYRQAWPYPFCTMRSGSTWQVLASTLLIEPSH